MKIGFIGLGIMGLADCLIKLGLTYGEEDAVEMCDNIGFAMADSAIAASAMLAKEKGTFDACNTAVSYKNLTLSTKRKVEE